VYALNKTVQLDYCIPAVLSLLTGLL